MASRQLNHNDRDSRQSQAQRWHGYTSLYTPDSSGDLNETYLTVMGQPWATQNLSTKYGTSAMMNGTAPTAVTHRDPPAHGRLPR
jgi:hypothetical protein